MEINVWGSDDADLACLVFPSSEGRFFQYEDEGMIHSLWHLIEGRKLQMFCADSVDSESFFCGDKDPGGRARRHIAYERYVVEEVAIGQLIPSCSAV